MSRISSKTIFLGIVGLASFAYAKSGWGEACSQANSHLDSDTWALDSDCDATTYCADNSTCAYRGCRKDIYPFGYNGVAFDQLPALCPLGQFCPDEGDRCLDQVPVGGSCQKDRDDECAPPPDWNDLNGYLNVNGTVCLNFVCQYANVTLGLQCILENTPYTGYLDSGAQYAFVISRDNCANGLYCDGTAMQCMKDKAFGAACTGNKECLSYNCGSDHKCGRAADEPIHPGTYAYVLVGLGITILILSVMISLWFVHRRSRKENQIKLEQYYNEQIAYRQSIMSMSHAKNSLLSLPPNTSADQARRSIFADPDDGFASAHDLSVPNIRRDSSAAWSDAAASDSEILLNGERNGESSAGPRYRG